ncbi:MAG: APC family permease [Candidatus Jordarchaeum sp.]|uniref:APC family permease n=1 Tax=Candidatus Jordarchaeum sp. TaxID=2823881 RepID=UPI00404A66A2
MSGSSSGKRIVFTRDATGLVREISIKDAVVITFSFIIAGGIMFLSVQSLAPGFFPGANLSMSYIGGLLLMLPISIVYAVLARAMPRSGGDYVYISRILGPGWGFIASWGSWIVAMFTIGVLCFQAVSFISLFTTYYGLWTWNLGLLGWSIQLTDPAWSVVFGIILIIFFGLVLMVSMRGSLWIMRILFVLPLLAGVATIWVLGTHSPIDMLWAWNTIFGWEGSSLFGIPLGAYGEIFQLAYRWWWWLFAFNASFNGFGDTMGAVIVAMFAFSGSMVITYIGGEVRDTKRTFFYVMVVGLFAIALFYLGILYPLQANYGPFISAYNYLTYLKSGDGSILYWWLWGSQLNPANFQYWIQYGAWSYLGRLPTPIPASVPFFAAPLAGLNWLGLFIIAGGTLWLVNYIMPGLLTTSRYIFAWSFDRLMPTRLSKLSERSNTPIYAIGVSMLIAMVGVTLSYWSALQQALNIIFLSVIVIALTVISGLRFYARRRDLAEVTYYPRIGRVPVLIISGIIAIIAVIPLLLAALATFNIGSLLIGLIVYLVGASIYLIMKRRNKKAGVDIETIFKEIPPE